MFNFAGTGGGYYRNSDIVPNVVDQLDIKAAVGTILINAVE